MTRPLRLRGVPASVGVAIAPAQILGLEGAAFACEQVEASDAKTELARFEEAVGRSREEIENAKQELMQRHGPTYAPILDVYLLMHGDTLLLDAVREAIRNDGVNAEWAVARVTERLREPLLQDDSAYFQERARDIAHVKDQLLRQLSGEPALNPPIEGPVVLIAYDMAPADAVRMLAPPTAGLVTVSGAASSHTAILARTFGVPMVAGVGTSLREIIGGEEVLVDGFSGDVAVGIGEAERAAAESRQQRFATFVQGEGDAGRPHTEDGVAVTLTANIGLPGEVEGAIECHAEGIGLYRTEMMWLDRSEPPGEEAQFEVYRSVVSQMAPGNVVFRTFDWRGDKRLRTDDLERHEREWLKSQIRAVLRASSHGSAALMFPVVATLGQLRDAAELVEEARAEVEDESALTTRLPLGMMVEVPSAALLADQFARHVDFFAVGTNDLTHYTLATSRSHASPGTTAPDPAVLRLLATTVQAAERASIPCSLCGDMAADPVSLGLAVGLGFRSVSVPVRSLPLARAVIRRIDVGLASRVAAEAIECDTANAVAVLASERLGPRLDPLWEQSGQS